jgi:hypothetical protein
MTRLPSLLAYCYQVIGAKALSIAPPIGKALGLMPREEVIMEKSKFLATVYANKPMRELTLEESLELSDLVEAFYKKVMPEARVFDMAVDDVPKEVTAVGIYSYLSRV